MSRWTLGLGVETSMNAFKLQHLLLRSLATLTAEIGRRVLAGRRRGDSKKTYGAPAGRRFPVALSDGVMRR